MLRHNVEYVSKHSRELLSHMKGRRQGFKSNRSVSSARTAGVTKPPRSSSKKRNSKTKPRSAYISEDDADFNDVNEHGPSDMVVIQQDHPNIVPKQPLAISNAHGPSMFSINIGPNRAANTARSNHQVSEYDSVMPMSEAGRLAQTQRAYMPTNKNQTIFQKVIGAREANTFMRHRQSQNQPQLDSADLLMVSGSSKPNGPSIGPARSSMHL